MKVLLPLAFFIFSIAPYASAQKISGKAFGNEKIVNYEKESVVPIIKQIGSRQFRCQNESGVFRNEYELQKLATGGDGGYCVNPADLLKIDFEKQTLIGYQLKGDCFVRGRAQIFRTDETKTYRVQIMRKSGGCHSLGFFQGWVVIDKMPPDYKTEFSETVLKNSADRLEDELLENVLSLNENLPKINARTYDMDRCVQGFGRDTLSIKTETELLQNVRQDASRKSCLEKLEKIDFKKEILLGTTLYTGYCRYPNGLKHQMTRDDRRKRYVVFITYDDPYGRTCRALGMYDLWFAVPKPPAGYEIRFEVASVFNERF